jgi:hypothetical protein
MEPRDNFTFHNADDSILTCTTPTVDVEGVKVCIMMSSPQMWEQQSSVRKNSEH